jgi:23S rRNA (pseudouridine1915-N3)-methyltransferase
LSHNSRFSIFEWLRAQCVILDFMNLTLAHVGARANAKDEFNALTEAYLGRCSGLAHCNAEAFRTEEALLEWLKRLEGRTPVVAVLLDSRGKQMSSETFAAWLGQRRDEGTQQIVFAVGPASGWSEAARKRAQLLLSLGPMTMAHALARLVMAEQIYRAYAILTGHPYHGGH